MARTQPNWSLLPPEILHIILEKVTGIRDYLCFPAICRSWRDVAFSEGKSRQFPLQLPWLLLPYELDGSDIYYQFYDLHESKTHKLFLPEMNGKKICGSSHGWFVLLEGHEFTLFNPITRATFSLPSVFVPPNNLGFPPRFIDEWDPDEYVLSPNYNFRVIKAVVTSNPLLDEDCMVVVLFSGVMWDLAFCRIRDEKWTVIEFGCPHVPFGYELIDFTYSCGLVYVVSPFGSVTVYDLRNRTQSPSWGGVGLLDFHLVDGVCGNSDILLIYDDRDYMWRDSKYVVSKLCSVNGEKEWFEETDIGENMIFMAGSHAISLPFKYGANFICYWMKHECKIEDIDLWKNEIVFVRKEDGAVSEIKSDLCITPDLSKLDGKWQKFVWLTPSLV